MMKRLFEKIVNHFGIWHSIQIGLAGFGLTKDFSNGFLRIAQSAIASLATASESASTRWSFWADSWPVA